MPTVTIAINEFGKLDGATPRDAKAYAKFRDRVAHLGRDGCLTFEWREPRSGPFHRRHFAMINALFECQEQFADEGQFRKWLEVGAGHCDFVPGPTGRMVAIPRSIAYEKLDQVEFQAIHEAVFSFARSDHTRRFLWPHLGDEQSSDMVDAALVEFE